MLTLKSRHTFRSTGPDRLATSKADQLPKLAKRQGWDFALLADERTMAGCLEFLEAARKIGLKAAAGIQLSGLNWPGGSLTMILIPMNQDGLTRLISAADHLAKAETIDKILEALKSNNNGKINVTCYILADRECKNAHEQDIKQLRAQFLDAFIGPVSGLCEAGSGLAELWHAPWESAAKLHREGHMPLGKLRMGYAAEDLTDAMQEGLIALANDNADKNAARAAKVRPRMPERIGIPKFERDTHQTDNDAVSTTIQSKIEPTTLSATPTLPAKLGLKPNEDADQTLREKAYTGLARRLTANQLSNPEASAHRLEYELEIIISQGFSNYFLIVHEAVAFAQSQNIPVGPGRGSVAGSMVAYALRLTNIDPLRHGLIFERFINPERVSLPDIDTDFDEDRRHEVIAHMAEIYGDEHVAHISTYGTNKPRGAVRTAGRILNLSAAATKLMSQVEDKIGNIKELSEAQLNERVTQIVESLAEESNDPDIGRLASLTTIFLGVAANQGIHAGGIVLSDNPIRTIVPLNPERTDHGRLAVQYDMRSTEYSGLVKFDFLGLTTLTIIKDCLTQLKDSGIDIDIDNIPTEDPKVFEMIRKGKTHTVFQIERRGISQAAREIGVDKFDDIVALVALYRPGPMANIPEYASRKRGSTPVSYLHPTLESALSDTYGIIIYQEQIMRIVQDFAGYTMGEADILRKAVGKKDAALLKSQKDTFMTKAMDAGRPEDLAEQIWDFFLPFARYGFNKSHAAAYATVSYQTAWLKCHYPAEWYAACASRKDDTESRARLVAEAEKAGIKIVLPEINLSEQNFKARRSADNAPTLILPLRAVDGTRKDALATIFEARQKHGPFKNFTHFLSLTDASCDSTIANLIGAGAFDSLSSHSPTISRPHFDKLLAQPAYRASKASNSSQTDLLFAMTPPTTTSDPEPKLWPQHPSGIKALAPEEALAVQEHLLKGMIAHQGGQIKATTWLRIIEDLPDLAAAERVAVKTDTPTLAILVHLGEREQPGSAKIRTIQATIEDETGRHTFDLARSTNVDPALAKAKGRVVRLTLSPAPHQAFINDRPLISSISLCENPLTQVPPPYPIIHLDRELDEELRAAFTQAILNASRAFRANKKCSGKQITTATHALLVPPSRLIEPLELTTAIRHLGPTEVFSQIEAIIETAL
jgi:DNA polymerase-3 subunit alpha